ncbi:MAG: ABC transporter permease [Candidatus Omnitrophica bacterium]|nr:ABC transporter permease [Candidatus Omnitrophota bacterium]MDE2008972.1 ABC transporter permease [Candidatus Omnitrophota bacterium]MDE2214496.1 ABC transporter permease [Candidatus Omnitrophota bacterium]MDE2230814.1 ABC transporter permease [Candidatus Omnitrophota bacterium]
MKRDYYIALKTIVRKETTRIIRIWTQTLLPPLITQTLYFVIFGKFIGSQVAAIHGVSYMEFIVPGLVMMAVISNAYGNVVASFYGAKFQRNIEEILISPAPDWVIIVGYALGGVVRGVVVGFLVFGVSLFFAHATVTHWWAVILFTLFSSVLFSLAALINGIFAQNFDEVAFFQNFILTPLIYLGGVFYSIHSLPQAWQKISLYNPLVYMVNGFRYGFFGFSDVDPGVCLVILVVLTAVLMAINLFLFKKGIGLKN